MLSYYYENYETDEPMPKTFTQDDISEIFKLYEPTSLYWVAAEFGAIPIMKMFEGSDRLFMGYEGTLGEFVMYMDINALKHHLKNYGDLGVSQALAVVIEKGDIEKAQAITKYYEIVEVYKLPKDYWDSE